MGTERRLPVHQHKFCWNCAHDLQFTKTGDPCPECGRGPRPGYNWRAEVDSLARILKIGVLILVLIMGGSFILMVIGLFLAGSL